jgi:hypothetical protein
VWHQRWRFVYTDMEKHNNKVWLGATNQWARHLIGGLWFIEGKPS